MADDLAETTPPADIKFYAAILDAAGDYRVEEFPTLDELVSRMKELVDRDVSAFAFAGEQLKISKAPFRHLLTPWGAQPLFSMPDALEPDDSGYLGADPAHLEAPTELPTQRRPAMAADDNEFFADNDENSFNVFDQIMPDPDS